MVDEDKLVEVIEDGRIAKVPEFYARREGLPIIRRPEIKVSRDVSASASVEMGDRGQVLDNFRKPSDWKEKQVLSELVDNFHWVIRVERRKKSLTRKQFAKLIGEKEEILKMIENGVLPAKDFVLINKIQDVLGVNLRKDKKDYSKSAREMIKEGVSEKKRAKEKEEFKEGEIYGNGIEIIGDEF